MIADPKCPIVISNVENDQTEFGFLTDHEIEKEVLALINYL